MTNREFYTTIINADVTTMTAEALDTLKAEATARLTKLDATNEARKNKPSKKATENAPLMEQIATEILTDEAITASQVAEALGVTTQKASSLLRALVADGRAVAMDVKLPKKGTCKAYRLPDVADAE